MNRLTILFLLAVSLLVAGCGGGGGGGNPQITALFVDPGPQGNDGTGDGSIGKPYKSIKRTLQDSSLSTVLKISLKAGTYNAASGEVFPLVIPANVQVEGSGPTSASSVVAGGAGDVTVMQLGSGAKLTNCTVQSGSIAVSRAVYIGGGSHGSETTVTNCVVSGSGIVGSNGIEVTAGSPREFIVKDSTINAANASGISIGNAKAIAAITHNTFTNCATGVELTAGATSGADKALATLRSNTFTNTTGAAVSVLGGIVDAGTITDAGNNTFNNVNASPVHLSDARGTGALLSARGNTFTPAADCGTTVMATAGSGGWDIGTATCESGIFVDDDATSPFDGTSAHPYKTITAALADANAGNLPIVVRAGSYSTALGETFPITVPAGVTIQGDPTAAVSSVIVTGGSSSNEVFETAGAGVTLKHMRIVTTYNAGGAAHAIFIHHNTTLDDLVVASTGGGASPPDGIEVDQASVALSVTNCTISAPTANGLLTIAETTILVSGCTFTSCAGAIVQAGPGGINPTMTIRNTKFNSPIGTGVQVSQGVVDLGTTSDPGNNTFTACSVDLLDLRTAGAVLQAIDNSFSANPPTCTDNIKTIGAAPGWHWRVTGGTEGTCP